MQERFKRIYFELYMAKVRLQGILTPLNDMGCHKTRIAAKALMHEVEKQMISTSKDIENFDQERLILEFKEKNSSNKKTAPREAVNV